MFNILKRYKETDVTVERISKIKSVADKCKGDDKLETEEGVKMTLILPLISALGMIYIIKMR